MRRAIGRATLTALIWAAVASPLASQTDSVATVGRMSGRVVDAQTGEPLAGSRVTLSPIPQGTVPQRGQSASAYLTADRIVVTGADGAYEFTGLSSGRFRLWVRRLGYRAATLDVDLSRTQPFRMSVGLNVVPIRLEPTTAVADKPDPFRTPLEDPERSVSRVAAAQQRQDAFLGSDVRSITQDEVLEAVTLGETDLFRALHRLPGVGTRDDFTAEIWTRGAGFGMTRVYYEGLPVFNPVSGFGVFSAINTGAVGGAFFHPGVRPADVGEGVAGVLDITSRHAGGTGDVRGNGELSMVSGRIALDQRVADGRVGWALAARRSHLDLLADAVVNDQPNPLPYSFADVAGAFDVFLDDERSLDVSALWKRDGLRGDIEDVIERNTGHWDNALARIRYSGPFLGVRASHRVGASRFSNVVRHFDVADQSPGTNAPSQQETDNRIDYFAAGSEITPRLESLASPSWRVGYQLVAQHADYLGPPPAPYAAPVLPDTLSVDQSLVYGVLWGEKRFQAKRFEANVGVRVELGTDVANGGPVRLGPRISARYHAADRWTISGGFARSYQYTQTLGRSGEQFGPNFRLSRVWVMAGDTVPAVRSDILTLGSELWLADRWLASATVYTRHDEGLMTPDPTPRFWSGRPSYVVGNGQATGVDLQLRRLAGSWTMSLGYSFTHARFRAAGLEFPAPAERPHMVDVTFLKRLGRSVRIGAAFTAASGVRFTRVLPEQDVCNASGQCGPDGRGMELTSPNGARGPGFQSLDLLFDWSHAYRAWDFGIFLQLRNALRHDNAGSYEGSDFGCFGYPCPRTSDVVDRFSEAMPLFPIVGFRVAF